MYGLASRLLAGLLSLGATFSGAGVTHTPTAVQAAQAPAPMAQAPAPIAQAQELTSSNLAFWRYAEGLPWARSTCPLSAAAAKPTPLAMPAAQPSIRRYILNPVRVTPAPQAPAPQAPAPQAPAPQAPAPEAPAPQAPAPEAPAPQAPAPQAPAPEAPAPQAPAPQAPAPQIAGLTADEQRMVQLVNAERANAGLPPLEVDLRLVMTARAKSQDMIASNYFSHNSPTLGSPFDQMRAAGIRYSTAGENIAGNQSVDAAHQALMNSPGHRANILNRSFNRIGIGIIRGGRYGIMVTQQFIGV